MANLTGPLTFNISVVDSDELDALREAVEILEDRLVRAVEDFKSQTWELEYTRDKWFTLAKRFDEFRGPAYEAVEVLEDQLTQAEEHVEPWKEASKAFYGETLTLKAQVRELTSQIIGEDWRHDSTYDALDRTKAALADAQEKIKELHETIATILRHATIRQLASKSGLEHEASAEFWHEHRNVI